MNKLKRGDWFKLERGNDWGHDYWSRAPKAPGWGTCSASRAYRLVLGETLCVRLLDGSERNGVVELVSKRQTVGDHGHDYDVTSQVPRFGFPDGTKLELENALLMYEPDRDPTAEEIEP